MGVNVLMKQLELSHSTIRILLMIPQLILFESYCSCFVHDLTNELQTQARDVNPLHSLKLTCSS